MIFHNHLADFFICFVFLTALLDLLLETETYFSHPLLELLRVGWSISASGVGKLNRRTPKNMIAWRLKIAITIENHTHTRLTHPTHAFPTAINRRQLYKPKRHASAGDRITKELRFLTLQHLTAQSEGRRLSSCRRKLRSKRLFKFIELLVVAETFSKNNWLWKTSSFRDGWWENQQEGWKPQNLVHNANTKITMFNDFLCINNQIILKLFIIARSIMIFFEL